MAFASVTCVGVVELILSQFGSLNPAPPLPPPLIGAAIERLTSTVRK